MFAKIMKDDISQADLDKAGKKNPEQGAGKKKRPGYNEVMKYSPDQPRDDKGRFAGGTDHPLLQDSPVPPPPAKPRPKVEHRPVMFKPGEYGIEMIAAPDAKTSYRRSLGRWRAVFPTQAAAQAAADIVNSVTNKASLGMSRVTGSMLHFARQE